jgi:hypothetical protein
MAAIYELCASSNRGIFAVPFRAGRCRKAVRLADGAIVERPMPDQRCEAPANPERTFQVGAGGVPATIHHACLGLVTGFLEFTGVYLLPSGEVAAVYGATANPIGAGAARTR